MKFEKWTLFFCSLSLFFPSLALAYTFQWEANHPNDLVVKYKIYWSEVTGHYNLTDSEEIPVANLPDPANPQWTLKTMIPVSSGTVFFVCTAVDKYGNESDYSNEITRVLSPDSTSPSIIGYPLIDYTYHTLDVSFSKSYMQDAGIEANYLTDPGLSFITNGGSDDIAFLGNGTYRLSMTFIPSYTIFKLTVVNVTDAAGNPLTSAAVIVNDNDNDGMADDWEAAYNVEKSDEDSDIDGLTNLQEFLNRTDPNNPDTDNDSLPDGWEIAHGTDPDDEGGDNGATGDPDNDGWTNFQEYLSNTDPFKSDPLPHNQSPNAPALNYPADGSETPTRQPMLSVSNSTDSDGNFLSYHFEIYSEDGLKSLVIASPGIPETPNSTAWTVDRMLDDNCRYYWRARSYDGTDYSEWMNTAAFLVNTANDPPSAPGIDSPAESTEISTIQPVLTVKNAADIDSAALTYEFEIYRDEHMATLEASRTNIAGGKNGTTAWPIDVFLSDNRYYWWRCRAMDDKGLYGEWTVLTKFFVNTSNDTPSVPRLKSPPDGTEVEDLAPLLEAYASSDTDLDLLTYVFEIDKSNTFDSTSLVRSLHIDDGQGGTIFWRPAPLDDNSIYYWRVAATDGAAFSQWSDIGALFINSGNDAPSIPVVKNPGDASSVATLTPLLTVNPAIDVDLDHLTYEFEVYADEYLNDRLTAGITPSASWLIDIHLENNARYYWRVRAMDEHGASSEWSAPVSFLINLHNVIPLRVTLNNPVSGGIVSTLYPVLSVISSTDADTSTLYCEFELYADQNLKTPISTVVIPQKTPITSWYLNIPLEENRTYYWRAKATDGLLSSTWTPTAVFQVKTTDADTILQIEKTQEMSASVQMTQVIEVVDENSPIAGVRVEVPPGALYDDCTITISRVLNPPALPDDTLAIGPVLNFGPDITSFAFPVSILIPYSRSDLERAGVSDPAQLEVLTYNPDTLSWEFIPIDRVDTNQQLLVCNVHHFSMYTMAKSITGANTVDPKDTRGCFIATAAYGSILQPKVKILRNFRDRFLNGNYIGSAFVRAYYALSPPLADFIARYDSLRHLVRLCLLPLVGISWIAVRFGFPYGMSMLIVLCFGMVLSLLFIKRNIKKSFMKHRTVCPNFHPKSD